MKYRKFIVGDDVTSVYWFTSSSTVELKSLSSLASDDSGSVRKLEMVHRAQRMYLKPLNCYKFSGFSSTWMNSITKTCFQYVVPYCCDIPDVEKMSCIRHGTRVQRTCVFFGLR